MHTPLLAAPSVLFLKDICSFVFEFTQCLCCAAHSRFCFIFEFTQCLCCAAHSRFCLLPGGRTLILRPLRKVSKLSSNQGDILKALDNFVFPLCVGVRVADQRVTHVPGVVLVEWHTEGFLKGQPRRERHLVEVVKHA